MKIQIEISGTMFTKLAKNAKKTFKSVVKTVKSKKLVLINKPAKKKTKQSKTKK